MENVCIYLWPLVAIFNLTGIEALLLRVLHAGKHSRAAEAYRVNGAFIMEVNSIGDDLRNTHRHSCCSVQPKQNECRELWTISRAVFHYHNVPL